MATVIASHHVGFWQERRGPSTHIANIHLANMMPPYNLPRTMENAPVSREYQPTTTHMDIGMPLFSASDLTTNVPYQSGVFAFDSVSTNPYNMQQTTYYTPNIAHNVSYATVSDVQANPPARDAHASFLINRNPMVKSESTSPIPPTSMFNGRSYATELERSASEQTEGGSINFATDVDTLMRAIQAKNTESPQAQEPEEKEVKSGQKSRKRYQCSMPNCSKSFFQKTHLDIHIRAHTGAKPFNCKAPGCGQSFSQLGNLKTHERRHTGERPYSCDICGKTFAQRGNVRAHKIVHQQIKPFTCKLDDCGKQFTQLGNLKSHQNKFHAATLRYLTQKFANITTVEYVSREDKELWEYFASLYKNSNKGIKGRGKDRRISAISSGTSNPSSYAPISMASMSQSYPGSIYHSGSDCSSRSSPMSIDTIRRIDHEYDFNPPLHPGYHQTQSTGYDDMVFPERKLY